MDGRFLAASGAWGGKGKEGEMRLGRRRRRKKGRRTWPLFRPMMRPERVFGSLAIVRVDVDGESGEVWLWDEVAMVIETVIFWCGEALRNAVSVGLCEASPISRSGNRR